MNIWNLNEKKFISSLKKIHDQGAVTCLEFLPHEDIILITGSGANNSLFEWKYDNAEDTKFVKIR